MGLFLYLIPVAIYFFYKWLMANEDFFKNQGIPYLKPFENLTMFFKKQPLVKTIMDNYNKFEGEKYDESIKPDTKNI